LSLTILRTLFEKSNFELEGSALADGFDKSEICKALAKLVRKKIRFRLALAGAKRMIDIFYCILAKACHSNICSSVS
jgi:hypothetical protein